MNVVVKELLKRGMPLLVFEKYGQAKPIPANSTKTINFRRYYLQTTFSASFTPNEYFNTASDQNFDPADRTLGEGVTPSATELRATDYTATLVQYGDRVVITDVVMDTHEDPVMAEAIQILGEQAAIIIEKTRFNTLKAGTNVFYSDGTDRTTVASVISLNLQRKVTRFLKRQLAKPITTIVKSTPAYGTESIAASFIAVCHPDMEADLRNIASFVPAEKYGSMTPMEGEIGKIEDCRYIMSTIVEPWADAATAALASTNSTVTTGGTYPDVYPVLYFARDAYGLVPLKGKNSITPMVVNPKPTDSDPLAQRGHVSWKGYQATIILNDFWMCRAEVAVSALS